MSADPKFFFPTSDRQSSGAYEVPPIIVQRRNLGLEIDTRLSRHNVVVTQALVPRRIVENALLVHRDPSLLEAKDARRGEVHTRVVEVVANGDEGAAVLHGADLSDVGRGVHLHLSSIGDVLLVARVAVVADLIRGVYAKRLEVREDLQAEVVRRWLPAGPAIVTNDTDRKDVRAFGGDFGAINAVDAGCCDVAVRVHVGRQVGLHSGLSERAAEESTEWREEVQ